MYWGSSIVQVSFIKANRMRNWDQNDFRFISKILKFYQKHRKKSGSKQSRFYLQVNSMKKRQFLFTALLLVPRIMPEPQNSGPHPFWHQGRTSVMKTIYFKCFVKLNGCFRWNSKSSPCDSVLARSFLWLSLVYILRSGLKLGGQIALICDIILTTTTRAKGSRVSLVFLRSPFCDFDHFQKLALGVSYCPLYKHICQHMIFFLSSVFKASLD